MPETNIAFSLLIIDPDEQYRHITQEKIKKAFPSRVPIYEASTLEESVEILDKHAVDLIIADPNVPDSPPEKAIKILLWHNRNAPVIVQSEIDCKKQALGAVKMGAQDYLIKHRGDENTLRRIIEYSLERKRFIARLEEMKQQVEEANRNLEQRVQERTMELEHAKNVAEASVHARMRFFTNVTHELRTPIHAITNFCLLGKQKAHEARPEKLQEYFEDIHHSGQRLLQMVNDVLDLSRLQSGKIQLNVEEHPLDAVILEAINEVKPLLEQNDMHIVIDNQMSKNTKVHCDRFCILQVFSNILSNAVKYTPANKHAHIKVIVSQYTPNSIKIDIKDQGIGIADSDLDAIFCEFSQSDKKMKTSTYHMGTGLGLAICKEVIEVHHGKIWAENNPEGGACFTFTLPLHYSMGIPNDIQDDLNASSRS